MRFATNLDTVTGLWNVDSIAAFEDALFSLDAKGMVFGFNVGSQDIKESLDGGFGLGTGGKVVDLTADWDFLTRDGSRAEILLMGGALESHLIDQCIIDHSFPQDTGVRVALESVMDRDNILELS